MSNYFVLFHTENNGEVPMNDVVEYTKDVRNIQDIKNIERIIEKELFDDGRKITLLNFKKLEVPTQNHSLENIHKCLLCSNDVTNDNEICNECIEILKCEEKDDITQKLGGWCFKCGTYYGECGCR